MTTDPAATPLGLTPRLIVSDGAKALEFYQQALGATVRGCYTDPNLEGKVIHAELAVGESVFTLTDAFPEFDNRDPGVLGGSPVMLSLRVPSADALQQRMQEAGAEVVIPVADRFYGAREGRLRDPFGHLWIISQHLEDLSDEEIMRRIAAYAGGKGSGQ